MVVTFIIIFAILCLSLIFIMRHVQRRKEHPPGPLGLPLVGLLPFKLFQILFINHLPKLCPIKYFKEMRKKYGDYWSMEMGGQRIVVFASLEIATEAFVNNGDLFAARPNNEVFKMIGENQGILFIYSDIYKENRRVALKSLKEFGMGKSELEGKICEEGNKLVKYLANISSSPIDSLQIFVKAVSSVISILIFNESNNYDDPDFETYVKDLRCAAASRVLNNELSVFPRFASTKLGRFLFPEVDEFFKAWASVKEHIKNRCKNKLKHLKESITPDCVFSYFWKYRYQNNIDDNQKFHEVLLTMVDLVNAGSETCTDFLSFSCLILGLNQDLQDDLRNELRELTEDYQQIDISLRKNCPKLLSFMDEIHRYFSGVPVSFRSVTEPCIFRGCKLYTEDVLLIDIGTIFKDPSLFADPDTFQPYRFMDDSKTKYLPNKYSLQFGVGKRTCIGESLANMQLFLFLSRIIFNFQISLPKETLAKIDDIFVGESGFTHGPSDHQVIFKPLHSI